MLPRFSKNVFRAFAGISILALILFCIHYVQIKNGQYAYSTKQDYFLEITDSEKHELKIRNGKTTIPKAAIKKKASYFLKVNAKSNLLGLIKEPSIRIKTNNHIVENTFEIGFNGNRYLNISNSIENYKNEIVLNGIHCDISDQTAELIVCPLTINKDDQILIVAPHPDDAEIAAFGFYSQYPNVFILTITMGEGGAFKYDEVFSDSISHYRKVGQLRTWNSLTVGMLGNKRIDNMLNLGYFDTTLGRLYEHQDSIISSVKLKTSDIGIYNNMNTSGLRDSIIRESNWAGLVENLRMVCRNVKPRCIITPFPELDTHIDHKFSTLALIEALKKENAQNIDLLLYSNHYRYCGESFPFGPNGTSISIPPIFEKDSIKVNSMLSFPLNKQLQKDKYFALEAMHDLRQDTEWRTFQGALKTFVKESVKGLYGYNQDYYRRAVRSNELFFVKKIEAF